MGIHHWDLADSGTVDYILNQEKHQKKQFRQGWKMFVQRHGLLDGVDDE